MKPIKEITSGIKPDVDKLESNGLFLITYVTSDDYYWKGLSR